DRVLAAGLRLKRESALPSDEMTSLFRDPFSELAETERAIVSRRINRFSTQTPDHCQSVARGPNHDGPGNLLDNEAPGRQRQRAGATVFNSVRHPPSGTRFDNLRLSGGWRRRNRIGGLAVIVSAEQAQRLR